MPRKLMIKKLLFKAGYSEKAIKYYLNKTNVGSIENPDAVATYTGLPCGDKITLYLKLENEIISNAKFEYIGCAGTATSGSALTMLVKGKNIDEAWKITKDDVLRELDGLPESHCADLAVNALHKTLEKLKKQITGM
ncbi:MAG: iron-sulfur cluster assembly scaffold protein [Candidatus Bathyarchaeota archaeon]|nr:iron-sulfur cluster assembly scaffold protein [Candidatus Bathyarchaeota archaeon]